MKTSEFYFDLPKELIAQKPLEVRHDSRLMVVDRNSGNIFHKRFFQIFEHISSDDLLVFNDSKVIPARLFGTKVKSGGNIEILLLKEVKNKVWECLVKPAKRVKQGHRIVIEKDFIAEVIDRTDKGTRIIKFELKGDFWKALHKTGKIPLPPYIREDLDDIEKYQTIYSKVYGSVAAPTAGFHFSHEILDKLRKLDIHQAYITLHVNLGTFRPIKSENIEEHVIEPEYYCISKGTVNFINDFKAQGGKILSVGTTTARALEDSSTKEGRIVKLENDTSIFIYPGYKFKLVDKLLTNFHLPQSTLLLLVCAFAGKDLIFKAYKEAIKEKYRFFSFGDAMLII